MARMMSEKDAEKVRALFRLALPDDVTININKNLRYRRHEITFQRRYGGMVYYSGFCCSSKRDFCRESWYLLKRSVDFFKTNFKK